MPEQLKKLLLQLQKYSNRWWYLPLMALLVFLDLFIVVIPSEGLLVKSVLLKRRRWLYAPLFFVTASALGAVVLAYLTQTYGEAFIQWLNPDIFTDPKWEVTRKFIEDKGALAMALISLSPAPQQPAVILCALAHMDLWTLFLAVWLGRAPKYFLFAWLARESPKYFEKLFPKAIEETKDLQ